MVMQFVRSSNGMNCVRSDVNVQGVLMPHELEWLHSWDHRPTAVVMVSALVFPLGCAACSHRQPNLAALREAGYRVYLPFRMSIAAELGAGCPSAAARSVDVTIPTLQDALKGDCMCSAQALSDATAALAASDYKIMQINLRISTYSDTVAACERLYKQPIPTAYTRHVLGRCQSSLARVLACDGRYHVRAVVSAWLMIQLI